MFKFFNNKKAHTIEEVIETYEECHIELVGMSNYLYTINNMIGYHDINYEFLIDNIKDYIKEYRKYSEFYFYIEIGVNLYAELIDFLSRVSGYTFSLQNAKNDKKSIKVLVKINGDDLNNLYNADCTSTIIYSKFNKAIVMIDSIYFDNPDEFGLLNTNLDEESNMEEYINIINNFREDTFYENDKLVIEPDNKIIANNLLRQEFGEYNLMRFITPPLYKEDNRYYKFSNIDELINHVQYSGYAIDLMKYYKDLYELIFKTREEFTSEKLAEEFDCEEIVEDE